MYKLMKLCFIPSCFSKFYWWMYKHHHHYALSAHEKYVSLGCFFLRNENLIWSLIISFQMPNWLLQGQTARVALVLQAMESAADYEESITVIPGRCMEQACVFMRYMLKGKLVFLGDGQQPSMSQPRQDDPFPEDLKALMEQHGNHVKKVYLACAVINPVVGLACCRALVGHCLIFCSISYV